MKQNIFLISGLLFILTGVTTGCQKFVTVDPPITQLVTSSVFENDQTAIAAMNGIYSYMESTSGFSNGTYQSVGFLSGLSADELTNYSTSSDHLQFYKNALDKNNITLFSLWESPYQCIYYANSLLEGCECIHPDKSCFEKRTYR